MKRHLATLPHRLANALRYVLEGTPMPALRPAATRVGLLNTGELIVLLPGEGQLILGVETVGHVRAVLDADDSACTHTLGGPISGGVVQCGDPVHCAIKAMR